MGNMEENPTIENKPKPKVSMKKKLIVLTSVVIAVIILLAYLLGPGWSPIASIRDFDGDGRADAYDVFPHDPMNWTWGFSNITFVLDHDLLVDEYGMDEPVNYNIVIKSPNITASVPFTDSGTMTDSSVRLNCTYIFASGIKNWTEVEYRVSLSTGLYGWLEAIGEVNAFAGRSSTVIFHDFWLLI